MALEGVLGRVVGARVIRLGKPGAWVALEGAEGAPEVLVPVRELPEGTEVGSSFEVFVYLDSDDRPIATTRPPMLTWGEVAFLAVTDVPSFGAFFDWGLMKELLVPRAELTRDVARGERHPVGLYLDDTGRLAGTMRVSEMLRDQRTFEEDEWVQGEAWRKEPDIGVFVIVERRHVGLVPVSEPNRLERGEAARFRVASVLPDGRIELSLRDLAHREAESDGEKILAVLGRPGAPAVGDKSSPELVFELFGLSKKAFKRAVGGLLKRGLVSVDERGHLASKRR